MKSPFKIGYELLSDLLKALIDSKINSADADSKINDNNVKLRTSGQLEVHWDNLINKPNFADAHWKTPVATHNDLPTVGNQIDDTRIVADDGDGGMAIYTCKASSGTIDQQWVKSGDIHFTNNHDALINLLNDAHTQYLHKDGRRALTGNMDFAKYSALNIVFHPSPVAPANPVPGQGWYDTVNYKFMVYTPTGWINVSGAGALVYDKEFTATAGQKVFDVSSVSTYDVGTKSMFVFKNGTLLSPSSYTETSSSVVTLTTGATAGDKVYFRWLKNAPSVLNAISQLLDKATYTAKATYNEPVIALPNAAGQISLTIQGNTRTNLVKSPKMDIDTNADGVVDDFLLDIGASIVINKSIDSNAQKIDITSNPLGGSVTAFQNIENVNPGDIISGSFETKVSGSVTTSLIFCWFNGEAFLSSTEVIQNSPTAFTTVKLENKIAPANTTRVRLFLRVNATTANSIGAGWFRNVIIEKASTVGNFIVGTQDTGPQQIKVTGKNLFDISKPLYAGGMNSGVFTPYAGTTVTKNGTRITITSDSVFRGAATDFIRVESNTAYYLSANKIQGNGTNNPYFSAGAHCFDINKNFIGVLSNIFLATGRGGGTFTTLPGTAYIRLMMSNAEATTSIIEDVQLEKGTVMTAHEPYTETIQYTPPDIKLGSVPNGTRDEITSDGVYTKRIGKIIFDGSVDEAWGKSGLDWSASGTSVFYIPVPDAKLLKTNTDIPAISDKFTGGTVLDTTAPASARAGEWVSLYDSGANIRIRINTSKLTTNDVAGFKAWLASNPTTVWYQLANEVRTQIEEFAPLVVNGGGQLEMSPRIKLIERDSNVITSPYTIKNVVSCKKITLDAQGKRTEADETYTVNGNDITMTTAWASGVTFEVVVEYDSSLSTVPTTLASYPVNVTATLKDMVNLYALLSGDFVSYQQFVNAYLFDLERRISLLEVV